MRHVRLTGVVAAAAVVLAVPLAADARATHGFKGSGTGTFTITPTADPAVVLTEDVAVGHATRLGKYTLHARELVNLATLEVTDGSWTMVTKTGTLFGTYAGYAEGLSPTEIAYHVTGPILGGTGRWEGATGTIRFDGRADLAAGRLSDEVSGRLSRDVGD